MKFGARNQLKGTVKEIKTGGAMCEVRVQLLNTDYEMSSVMTMSSLEELGLKKGDTVSVIAKAVNVMLAK